MPSLPWKETAGIINCSYLLLYPCFPSPKEGACSIIKVWLREIYGRQYQSIIAIEILHRITCLLGCIKHRDNNVLITFFFFFFHFSKQPSSLRETYPRSEQLLHTKPSYIWRVKEAPILKFLLKSKEEKSMKTYVLALAVYIDVFVVTCNNKCQLVTIPKTGVDTFSPKNLKAIFLPFPWGYYRSNSEIKVKVNLMIYLLSPSILSRIYIRYFLKKWRNDSL